MSNTEYKIYCVNCRGKIAQVQVKSEVTCNCKNCGFYFILKSDNKSVFSKNLDLEIYLAKEAEDNNWFSIKNFKEIISCPFCAQDMKSIRYDDTEKYPYMKGYYQYNCEKCHRNFTTEYL